MKKNLTIATIAIFSVAITAVVAWGTIALLSSIGDSKKDTPSSSTPEPQPKEEEQPEESPSFGEPSINERLSKKAEAIEKEAASLMESDPAEAQKRYLAAAEAYREAGNVSKVSEMQANATTAEALLDDLAKQQAQSNNQN